MSEVRFVQRPEPQAGLQTVDSVPERSDESESTGSPLGVHWEQLPLAGDDGVVHAHVSLLCPCGLIQSQVVLFICHTNE